MKTANKNISQMLKYRTSMSVTSYKIYLNYNCYAICPRCNSSLDREFMDYCNNCGQKLSWRNFTYKRKKKDIK